MPWVAPKGWISVKNIVNDLFLVDCTTFNPNYPFQCHMAYPVGPNRGWYSLQTTTSKYCSFQGYTSVSQLPSRKQKQRRPAQNSVSKRYVQSKKYVWQCVDCMISSPFNHPRAYSVGITKYCFFRDTLYKYQLNSANCVRSNGYMSHQWWATMETG